MRTSIFTLCIPAVALSAASANTQISMGPPQTISVGIEPVDLTLGDFDLRTLRQRNRGISLGVQHLHSWRAAAVRRVG